MTDLAQAHRALTVGNKRRLKMAQAKNGLKRLATDEAFRAAADIIETPDEDQGAIRVHQILAACPRLGEVGIGYALMYAGIVRPDKRIRDLTERQRGRLASGLRAASELGPMSGLLALRSGTLQP